MDSFIIIEGIALWILLALIFLIILCFIYMGCKLIKTLRQNDRLIRRNTYLRHKLALTQDAYYKATFKVPEVDDV